MKMKIMMTTRIRLIGASGSRSFDHCAHPSSALANPLIFFCYTAKKDAYNVI